MKNKVTLKELLGTQIIIAILIAVYYWCWARNDWHEYYVSIQNTVGIFAFFLFYLSIYSYGKIQKRG